MKRQATDCEKDLQNIYLAKYLYLAYIYIKENFQDNQI